MILLNEKINLADLCDVTNRCIDEVSRAKEELENHRVKKFATTTFCAYFLLAKSEQKYALFELRNLQLPWQ